MPWIHVNETSDDAALLVEARAELAKRKADAEDERARAYFEAARQHHHKDGELEFDDFAVVSMGDDPGAYVMGWAWVYNAEAGLPDLWADDDTPAPEPTVTLDLDAVRGTLAAAPPPTRLKCDMRADCTNPVTHIGSKGWVYCAPCAADRQYQERCRRMRKWEIERLERGDQISYELMTRAKFEAKLQAKLQEAAPNV